MYDHFKKSNTYDDCKLLIVMRKRGGDYILIGRNNVDRLIEISSTGYDWGYDYEGLKALIAEYPELFDKLGVKE